MTPAEKTIRRESMVLRVLWMLLFLVVWHIAVPLLGLVVVAQLLYRLFYGAPSLHFMNFGDSLSQYLAQIGRFAVFNTDAQPWPVADWPRAHVADGEAAHNPKAKQTTDVSPVPTAVVSEPELAAELEPEQSLDESALADEQSVDVEAAEADAVETQLVATEGLDLAAETAETADSLAAQTADAVPTLDEVVAEQDEQPAVVIQLHSDDAKS